MEIPEKRKPYTIDTDSYRYVLECDGKDTLKPKYDNQFTNREVNMLFSFSACPHGSMDIWLNAEWYIYDLSRRMVCAASIDDQLTFVDLQARLSIHLAYRHADNEMLIKKTIERVLTEYDRHQKQMFTREM